MRLAAILAALAPLAPAVLGRTIADISANSAPAPADGDRPAIIGFANATADAPGVDPAALKARSIWDAAAAAAAAAGPAAAASKAWYVDASGAEHQAQFNTLTQRGLRMLSLAVSGDPANPRYAATWAASSGGDWAAIHDATQAQFEAFVAARRADGMVATLVSATGPPGRAVFAAVFEKKDVGNWEIVWDLSIAAAQKKIADTIATGPAYKIASMAFYGDPDPSSANTRYAFILHANRAPNYVQWAWSSGMPVWDYQRDAPGWVAGGSQFPSVVAGQRSVAVSVVRQYPAPRAPYTHGGGKNRADFDGYARQMSGQGWYPFSIAVSGTDAGALYWSLWTK